MTVPDVSDQQLVQVRVVTASGEWWAQAVALGWTLDVVCVGWSDGCGMQSIDWFPAGDVRRGD